MTNNDTTTKNNSAKIAIGLLSAIAIVLIAVSCSSGGQSQRASTGTTVDRPPASSTVVDLDDTQVREYLANAFRSLDSADQDTVCAAWLSSSPAERFELYQGIVAGVDGISDAQIDSVFPAYFASVCE